MSIYVASPTIVLMPEQAATQWKAYGQGSLLGAFVWGEGCPALLKKLQNDSLVNNQIIQKQTNRFFIEFYDVEEKYSLEFFMRLCNGSGEQVSYQFVYTDHWSTAVVQGTLLVDVDGFLAPLIHLDHTGEFELAKSRDGLSIILDDEEDTISHIAVSHTMVLDEGYYLLSDLGFVNDQEAQAYVVKHYFEQGTYEIQNEYNEQDWLVRIAIQKKQ
ncbi:hypothetical protein [Metabacillus iocasae]|uniref:Methyltransferase n=1 Tax=Priestia iocasae TaxID=2291674 RepID=A0ABS2QWH0_9BACI|nr:hypothetical protein [Metabacillus iocasae]MBM7703096.1 hypothetical protein [Metabacillus iocasae]